MPCSRIPALNLPQGASIEGDLYKTPTQLHGEAVPGVQD